MLDSEVGLIILILIPMFLTSVIQGCRIKALEDKVNGYVSREK